MRYNIRMVDACSLIHQFYYASLVYGNYHHMLYHIILLYSLIFHILYKIKKTKH
ncbi:hypothetical protein BJ944DRAFT_272189 [Cunninghamella echinulata]|nr:hypothetical protein BJ944DRAFT_272189 [Cunninghamella echinulata]